MSTAGPVSAPMAGQGWKPILYPSDAVRVRSQSQMEVSKSTPPPPTQTTPTATSSWGWNFFSWKPREVYVTHTVRELYTTKHMDPHTVVTFSVKGCRPSRLPFDLPECQPPRSPTPLPETSEKGIIVMAPIQFVPSLVPLQAAAVKEVEVEKVKDEKKEEIKPKVEEKKVEPVKEEKKEPPK